MAISIVKLTLFWASLVAVHCGSSDEMCDPALDKLVEFKVATRDLRNQLPNIGSPVCDGGPCCVPGLSVAMEAKGRHLIHSAMRAMATHLLDKVTAARDRFKESIEAAIDSSEESTLQSFTKSYPKLVGHAKEPLKQLYSAFRSFFSDPEENMLDRALETFWSDLFPLVYHSAIHSRLEPFTHGYMECLRKARSSHGVRPWKFVPEQIGDPLIKGLETAKLMIHSLDVGSDVILKARKYEIPKECGEPSARLYFCSSCHASMVPPCSGLCLNVARGCLAPLAELDGAWNDLSNAVRRVGDSIRHSGLADILAELPEIFSDAIMYAMESGFKLQKLVHTQCGPHSYEKSAEWEAKTKEGMDAKHDGSVTPAVSSPISHGTVIESLAEEAVSVVAVDFWTKIADDVCSHMNTLDTNCWNGKNVAEYSRPAAGVGVSAQKYNPEVTVARPDTSVYALADQLREVKRLVTKRLTWLPESDSYKRDSVNPLLEEGSGDERYRDTRTRGERPGGPAFDDEDGSEGSGAGPITGEGGYRSIGNPKYGNSLTAATQRGIPSSRPSSIVLSFSILTMLLASSLLAPTNIFE